MLLISLYVLNTNSYAQSVFYLGTGMIYTISNHQEYYHQSSTTKTDFQIHRFKNVYFDIYS